MQKSHYRIELGILITTEAPANSEVFKQRIKEEINIMCSRLERLEGFTNHIHIFKESFETV